MDRFTFPAAAPVHTIMTVTGQRWIIGVTIGIETISVPAPFSNISMHIVKFPVVRCLPAHYLMSLEIMIVLIPGDIIQIITAFI